MENAIVSSIEKALESYSSFPELKALLASSDLSPKVSVLAIGKSAQLMAKAATEVLEYKHIAYSGYY
ncbi:MAG: hypothetical protein PHY48_13850 [Candidatus Cloacimonetes bacterium]|nr:hypothetical protein [Candidatus Cloacimonadota bacterium]